MIPRPDLSNAPDKDLVAWALHGREEGFRGLVDRYGPAVFRRIDEIVHDQDVAEDLWMATFAKVFGSLHRHQPDRRLSAWIGRIAYNTAIDYVRRQKHNTERLTQDTPPPEIQRALAAPVTGRAERKEARRVASTQALNQAIERLTPNQRQCITLRFFEGKTPNEIAALLGMPAGTVKTHIHRGLNGLQNQLDPGDIWWLYDSPSDPFYSPLPD